MADADEYKCKKRMQCRGDRKREEEDACNRWEATAVVVVEEGG